MKRLTERLENGVINVKYASQHESAIHRLVTIEDILGNEYDLDRLRELAQADWEGRCVVLPCKVGDTVWYLTGKPSMTNRLRFDRVASEKVAGFYVDERGLQIRLDYFHGSHGTYGFFGKTVFLAREAAEKALEEMEKNENG